MHIEAADKTISHSLVEEIKKRFSIQDALPQYGGLKLTNNRRFNGNSYSIKCPFHQDRSPSFSIWPKTNTWKCWAGCGGGDVINLVSKFLSISNKEAIQFLQKELGLVNIWSSIEISKLKEDRQILQGLEETKKQIILQLIRCRNVFSKAMTQVRSFEDLDRLVEVYHFMPLIEMYLEELNSGNFNTQIAAVKYLMPIFLEVKIDEK
jgi:DNA primase